MELTGAAVAARKDRTMTRRGSVRVERWVRARWTGPVESLRRDWFWKPWSWTDLMDCRSWKEAWRWKGKADERGTWR